MKRILLLFLLAFPALLYAQEFVFQQEFDTIPVQMNGWDLFCPWVGGFSETAPDFCDIDADGDLDLFLGHYFADVRTFRNEGDSATANFAPDTDLADSLRTFNGGPRANPDFYDIDGDGDLDALVGSGFVTIVWNQGTSTLPDFNTTPTQVFDTQGYWVFGTHVALADIDSDNDGDLICGEYQGHLQFYRNIGTPDSFAFYLEDNQWLGVDVGVHADPALADIDADGDLDLFIGNGYDSGGELGGRISFYRNDGDSANYNFAYVTNYYGGIDVGKHASPEFADMDGDADYDLLIGREAVFGGSSGDCIYYINNGTPEAAQFELATLNYLTIDLGYSSAIPSCVDIDGDGNSDLLIGSGATIHYFKNIAIISSNPAFMLIDSAFQGISNPPNIMPFFADIDADGDYDLICGEGAIPGPPELSLYLNQGTPQDPRLNLYSSQYITNPDFFAAINPGLFDIDADGDFDLFIFDGDNDFLYYENTGGPSWPNFVLITAQWQGIHQFPYPNNGLYGFTFADLDSDGDLDLLAGSPSDDNFYFYRNVGTPQAPIMILQSTTFLAEEHYMRMPLLVDIDSDTDYDLLVGNNFGGLYFYRNITGQVSVPPIIRHPNAGLHLSLGPNPANPNTVITFTLPFTQALALSVYNLLGEKVVTLLSGLTAAGTHSLIWEGSQNASGIYLVHLKTEQAAITQKIAIIK